MRNLVALAVISLAVMFHAGLAAAEPVVIAVDGKDIYVDLGARDGVGAGTDLELLHEVVVRDPRTGATLRDHFALGTLSVVKSGDRISVAHANDDLGDRVLAGDRVRLVSGKRTFIDPWAEQVAASKTPGGAPSPARAPTPGAPSQPPSAAPPLSAEHIDQTRQALEDTLGQPLDKRVSRWLAFLAAHPRTPYLVAIQREVATLRQQIAARDVALASQRSERSDDRAARIAAFTARLSYEGEPALIASPIMRSEPGRRIDLSFAVRDPARVSKAWLYVRAEGEPGFHRIEMTADGDAYMRASIGPEHVRSPRIEWYVEATSRADRPGEPVIGSQESPLGITVERSVVEAPIESGRTHIDAHVDYVDFDGGFQDGYDQYYQAEIDFTYRFYDPVYAVRLGFGSLDGIGGPKDVIDEDPQCLEGGTYRCKRLSFSYIYAEVELRLRPNIALMLRPQAGLLTADLLDNPAGRCSDEMNVDPGGVPVGCDFGTGFGARARLRLGSEAGTNLVLGAGFNQGVGTLLEASYQWRPAKAFPVQLAVHVTDQPVVKDFGVRLIGDVGWRSLSWFYPSLRLSYQARDIDHAGFSGGLALNFDW